MTKTSVIYLFLLLLTLIPNISFAHKTAEDLILENPVREYKKYSARLRKFGANASFPEFSPVVESLKAKLRTEDFLRVIKTERSLQLELTEVNTILTHVNLDFRIEDPKVYPYDRPFEGPYPYRPTIDAIESALRLIDKVERMTNPKAVPLYHFDRYAYHRHSLLADPEIVIFPTLRPLTFSDLIRVRSVPLGFVGVALETIRVDRHFQSPLDFWYHDLNHVRRMCAYIALRAKLRGAKTLRQRQAFYKEMDNFIVESILPNIKALPKGAGEDAVAVRRLVRVIIFEILHETALTSERETVLADLLRLPDTPQPFEHMMPRVDFSGQSIEALRTVTGNIASGVAAFRQHSEQSSEPITIRYFHDRALSLLANVYNKLNYGFFDDPEDPNRFIAVPEKRKAAYIVQAAEAIMEFLGASQTDFDRLNFKRAPNSKFLLDLTLSKKGSPEKFIYPRLNEHEDTTEKEPETTEPLTAEEVVQKVKAIGKTVYTLFGYSALGYHKPREAMAAIRKELQQLDPKTTVINIGATVDGIGFAYEMAKEMGFETIGIVSTQALSNAGKFSKYVDRIYIVNDPHWGGYVPGSDNVLAPATVAFLEASDVISAHGGGEFTAVTLKEAKARGIKFKFTPAEMDHEISTERALRKGRPVPKHFHGAAQDWVDLNCAENLEQAAGHVES